VISAGAVGATVGSRQGKAVLELDPKDREAGSRVLGRSALICHGVTAEWDWGSIDRDGDAASVDGRAERRR